MAHITRLSNCRQMAELGDARDWPTPNSRECGITCALELALGAFICFVARRKSSALTFFRTRSDFVINSARRCYPRSLRLYLGNPFLRIRLYP